MSDCKFLASCPFFNEKMDDMPEHVELFKTLYCRGNSQVCARYIISDELGPDQASSDLFPNHVETANKILADARISCEAS